MRREKALIVFAKNLVPGKVKTRLAAEIGERNACEVYKRLLAYTLKVAKTIQCYRLIFFSDTIEGSLEGTKAFDCRVQRGADLGERMYLALEEILEECEKVVLIGSDCAEMDGGIIENAFEALDTHQIVVGPAQDGGYYLIGARNEAPDIFRGIDWGSDKVYSQTKKKLIDLSLNYYELDVLSDIDTYEDLKSKEWLSEFLH